MGYISAMNAVSVVCISPRAKPAISAIVSNPPESPSIDRIISEDIYWQLL